MCILAIIQATLGFLLDFLGTSALKLTPLRLGQPQRAPPWLEAFRLWLAALSFLLICISTLFSFFLSELSLILDLFNLDFHGANYKRFLLDAFLRCIKNLLHPRHIRINMPERGG